MSNFDWSRPDLCQWEDLNPDTFSKLLMGSKFKPPENEVSTLEYRMDSPMHSPEASPEYQQLKYHWIFENMDFKAWESGSNKNNLPLWLCGAIRYTDHDLERAMRSYIIDQSERHEDKPVALFYQYWEPQTTALNGLTTSAVFVRAFMVFIVNGSLVPQDVAISAFLHTIHRRVCSRSNQSHNNYLSLESAAEQVLAEACDNDYWEGINLYLSRSIETSRLL
jgi:hypothetical protein